MAGGGGGAEKTQAHLEKQPLNGVVAVSRK